MRRGLVLIFADKVCQDYVDSLKELGESIIVHPLNDSPVPLKQTEADLAIIDCGSSPDNGLRLLHLIKQHTSSLPVIFITNTSSEKIVTSAYQAGVREYFKKPFNMNEFTGVIDKILTLMRFCSEVHKLPENYHFNADISKRLLRALHFMDQNFTDQINLELIAQEACLSKFHFSRVFKKYIGLSPMHFLMKRRIDHACTLLCHTETNILRVAMRSGYKSLSEFHKQFKKTTGVTPSEYRNVSVLNHNPSIPLLLNHSNIPYKEEQEATGMSLV